MPLFRFAQLEFTHAVGIPAGAYTVDVASSAPGLDVGDADALVVEIAGGPAGIPLLLATLVLSSAPLADAAEASAELSRLRSDHVAQQALLRRTLLVINRGLRAYRIAALDPYVTEVMELDPRVVRFGYSSGGALGAGQWLESFEMERRAPPPPKARSVEQLSIGETVGASLAGTARLFEAEELALRALLDLRHDRTLAAAAGSRAAVEVLKRELTGVAPADQLEAVTAPDSDDAGVIEALALHILETAAAYRSDALRAGPASQ